MNPSITTITVATIIPTILVALTILINFQIPNTNANSSPFECGFDPINSARIPFSLRFFLLAVIFLIFDIEIVLLIPIPNALESNHLNINILTIQIFLIILLIGLLHEWREGSLEWN